LPAKQLILVMGPHRSGTSLCTHAVQTLGATTGFEKVYMSDENAKGFFEDERVIRFNDALLASLGGSWDNAAFDGKAAIETASDLTAFHRDATELLQDLFGDAPCVVLKDPRICQLLPFWESVFVESGFPMERIYYLHALRHPVEVALSQQARVLKNPTFYELGRNIEEGGALWLSLSAQSLIYTLGRNNFIVSYHDFLLAPESRMERIATFLGLEPDPDKVREFCQRFVDSALYRSKTEKSAETRLQEQLPQAQEFFDALLPLCEKGAFTDEDVKPALDIFRRKDTQQGILAAQVEALSRLSIGTREARTLLASAYRQYNLSVCGRASRALSYAKATRQSLSTTQMPKLKACILHGWLDTRRRLVSLAVSASKHYPGTVHHLRKIGSPPIRWLDRTAFRIGSGPKETADADFSRLYQQTEPNASFEPLVSVIVPNFNHALYLKERLESIYQQSYRNFEVILMDDCSKDDSVAILEAFRQKYPEQTRLIINERNSGGVFHQWEKGIQFARGEILWIAESDDYCTKNFLATLVPMFRNEAVMLAYSRTDFIRDQDEKPFWSINEYLHDIDASRWSSVFIETAHDIVNSAFAIKNIIPNVSSALFRKTDRLEILHDAQWKKMRVCGDWALYLHLIRGGMLAYSPEAINYYRQHDKNTSVSSHTQDRFYQEHETIAGTLRKFYEVPVATLEKQKQQLRSHWQRARNEYSDERFAQFYSLERIEQETPDRALNLLMAGYGFCSGGGETFPILLANLMKAHGYNVTFLDCNQMPRIDEIRRSLRSDIPVVSSLADIGQIVEHFNIDLIHSHHAWVDNCIVELVKSVAPQSCGTIITMHGMYETLPRKSAAWHLKQIVKHTDQIVYIADKNLDTLKEHGLYDPTMLTRIDNAFEVSPFTPLERDMLGIPDDAFVLTLVSRAMFEKGWLEAVQAVNKAREISGQNIHLILIGEGPAHDELSAGELPPYIHLEGFRKNILEYFATSDLGFLPSRFKGESFPLVVIESLHAGTPILASDLGEIAYMVGEAGSLFELREDWSIDENELAKKIAALATDKSLYRKLKLNVPQEAAKFDPELLYQAYDRVYRRALPPRD
jgi:glycosyltransferase involved in cell wall biosynthesis/GT2 family glycosyltransferase